MTCVIRTEMTDFNALTKIPFGWSQVFIFYILCFIFSDIVCAKKVNDFFDKKK